MAEEPATHRRNGWIVITTAILARLATVIWAAPRFPPAADGTYYQIIAERIARGHGYTWLWPDGAVTYAAHYPVGYPALIGAAYAVTGPHPVTAMIVNAILGGLAAFAIHTLARRAAPPKIALLAGLFVALHPGLVAYTPALMTEGVTASMIAIAAAIAAWSGGRPARAAALGVAIGVATLVRPQSLVLAPIFGALAALVATRPLALRRALVTASVTTVVTLAVVAPWTARNCVRMKRCALVSVNGGWNLLIGADEASTGAWSPVKVPERCREVFDEAAKDVCFGDEAKRYIAEHPARWLSLAPKKLAATFDYAGAAGYYLHASNPNAFPESAKIALGGLETLVERALLIMALIWSAKERAREAKNLLWARRGLASAGVLAALTLHAWIGYAALVVAALVRGRSLARGPLLASATAATIAATMATHAVFFGAGRYSLVVMPLLSGLAALALGIPSIDTAGGMTDPHARIATSEGEENADQEQHG